MELPHVFANGRRHRAPEGASAATSEAVALTRSQAQCLTALRDGFDGITDIAIETKQDLKAVKAALEALRRARLVVRMSVYRWRLARLGRDCAIRIAPSQARRGRGRPPRVPRIGATAQRLLALLDRPMDGTEIRARLGVTIQRVHQLVVALHALGRLRIGDRRNILLIVARSEDPAVLLSGAEARVLSAMPEEGTTTAPKAAVAAGIPSSRVRDIFGRLRAAGLVAEAGPVRDEMSYRMTNGGLSHLQRRPGVRQAAPLPPKLIRVRSDRVQSVLACIAERGEARGTEIRDALGIAQQPLNALMQYLKRKGLVRKAGPALFAPYALTEEGRATLDEMLRRSAG